MLTPIQCKMARAALGWNVKELAKHARISSNTVVRFENETHETSQVIIFAIRGAFEAAGVRFQEDGGIVPPKKSGE